jgi:hypothetical protein
VQRLSLRGSTTREYAWGHLASYLLVPDCGSIAIESVFGNEVLDQWEQLRFGYGLECVVCTFENVFVVFAAASL